MYSPFWCVDSTNRDCNRGNFIPPQEAEDRNRRKNILKTIHYKNLGIFASIPLFLGFRVAHLASVPSRNLRAAESELVCLSCHERFSSGHVFGYPRGDEPRLSRGTPAPWLVGKHYGKLRALEPILITDPDSVDGAQSCMIEEGKVCKTETNSKNSVNP
jgi:hypothetical protein